MTDVKAEPNDAGECWTSHSDLHATSTLGIKSEHTDDESRTLEALQLPQYVCNDDKNDIKPFDTHHESKLNPQSRTETFDCWGGDSYRPRYPPQYASDQPIYCYDCDRYFSSQHALDQHMQDSPAHTLRCEECDRQFYSQTALDRHLRDSPAHTLKCEDCGLQFYFEFELDEHLEHDAAHMFECEDCDIRFYSESALDQHFRDSSAHEYDCDECDRHFSSRRALNQHLRDSSAHGYW